jgi:DNA primase
MAGRIKDEDVAAVRDKARIDEVARDYVALKPAGGGSFKGLCPFHDERSPSFHVTPSKGMYYCFGCQEGGDVISFVQKLDHLTFAEAVEKLAGRTGITLRYEEGGAGVNRHQGQRTRLVEANKAAAEFFRQRLAASDAAPARAFLTERGFDADVAADFDLGFAPKSWDALTTHLRQRGFTDSELQTAGLVSQGNRGPYDRFRGRLIWPIRDLAGDIVGFGARRLLDDDEGPKYLNTPETPLYKKSQVLYGIDRARKEISKQQRVVVVEGYTDVMACQLAGVPVAVATCGTAFGADHIKVLRRLLMDDERMRGEVIFTFDGDEAGRRAALKAFDDDQRFVAQTFVAVEPHGLDPCDLRQQHGDAAVASLVQHRVPLFEFAIRSTLARYDLDSAEGRVGALREAAPIVSRIKDPALRPEYERRLAGWLGLDIGTVSQAVTSGRRAEAPSAPPRRADPRDPVFAIERESLKCALQEPALVSAWYAAVEPQAYSDDALRAVHEAIAAAGGPRPDSGGLSWIDAVLEQCRDDGVRSMVRGLAVEPLPVANQVDARYTTSVIARLLEMDAGRRISELRGRLQRLDEGTPEQVTAFADLMALEAYRRDLREQRES